MQGFSMPGQTTKVCMPKAAWEQPPKPGKDDKCTLTDVKRTGSRMTWKVKCDDGTTGDGDMTSSGDSYSGTMNMRTQGQEMHMKMKGRKVGGDCDAGEMKRKVAEVQKQVKESQAEQARAMEKMCLDSVEQMHLARFLPVAPGQPPPCAEKSTFCDRLETREGLRKFKNAPNPPGARAQAEKLCKKDLASIEAKLCATTAKDYQKTKKLEGEALEYLFAFCPDDAKAIAKSECAGRKFTSMPQSQREFCTKFAQRRIEAPGGATEDTGTQPQPASDMKSKVLKGIFGR